MENKMFARTFFSFSYFSDVKSLPGFVKGGRDKVPKEFGEYSNKLISGWSEKEIKEHIEAVATKSKEYLDISAREFKTPVYQTGAGAFDCQYFKYDFSVAQSEDDFSKCVFTGLLEIEDIESFNEIQDQIDQCFSFTFDKALSNLPKANRDLKELIYSLDDNKKSFNSVFDFTYENDFSQFQLVHKKDRTVIRVNDSGIEINFKASETIPEMFKFLTDVNYKIFSASQNKNSDAVLMNETTEI